jgi:hypothetical protein
MRWPRIWRWARSCAFTRFRVTDDRCHNRREATDTEEFSDGKRHWTIWQVDQKGAGTRIACNPASERETGFFNFAVAPGAVYVSDDGLGRDAPAWGIVRIAR